MAVRDPRPPTAVCASFFHQRTSVTFVAHRVSVTSLPQSIIVTSYPGIAMVALDGTGHTVPLPRALSSLSFAPYTPPQIITQPKSGWFYHRASLFDVNGDGAMDIVTARATPPGSKQQVSFW